MTPIAPPRLEAVSPVARPEPAAVADASRVTTGKVDDLDLAGWDPARADAPNETSADVSASPTPVAPAPVPEPVQPAVSASASASSGAAVVPPISEEAMLQQSFAALLAAEKTAILPAAPSVVSTETLEEIVRRVIARMGDESMRAAVLDVAERLVREEIARIKSQG
jgi:hypothetical protein